MSGDGRRARVFADAQHEHDGGAAARAMTDDLQRRISNARALTRSAADDDDPLAPDKVSMEIALTDNVTFLPLEAEIVTVHALRRSQ